ncbi:MAG: phosphoglycerate kinase [Malacoplasma sp.]|nr:phosphoglycerate kinase [Malacoplasma sp.]MDE5952506.1 phosphoglycerate kinase [Malacoplasma sp.]MDE6645989.1 phosphoglycerate kinase [Malacoplasma sp.]MDE6894523.1 phosphoglycerate kinase [Malacoplasma sp.]MDE7075683.1 phosphoglycerate kinase [Malacoplasma sp.]
MEYNKKIITDLHNLEGKRVLLRCDFNVPLDKQTREITDYTRIDAALKTIKYLIDKKAKVILLSHFSRIKSIDDVKSGKKSLIPVFDALKKKLPNVKIIFEKNNVDPSLLQKINAMENGSIMLLENTRYNDVNENGDVVKLESKNDSQLGKFWASLGDIFINDAFGTSHRSHASNVGISQNIGESALGFLVNDELVKLSKAINNPQKPVIAIFGGAKVSDKIPSIKNIGKLADKILIGGGMAYTFLKAQGYEIGISLFEADQLELTKQLLVEFKDKIVLPVDAVMAKTIDDASGVTYDVGSFNPELEGVDIGEKSIKKFKEILKNAKTVIWNGPLGVFENNAFSKGTLEICKYIAEITKTNNCYSVIGGGDSAAAAVKFGVANSFSHISTGGGASLEFFSGDVLPGINCINNKN